MNAVKMLLENPPQPMEIKLARRIKREFRKELGLADAPLLTAPDGNAKMKKAGPLWSLSLAPHRIAQFFDSKSGKIITINVCPWSTPECRGGCVAFVGQGAIKMAPGKSVNERRAIRNRLMVHNPDAFCTLVKDEIETAVWKENMGLFLPWHTGWTTIGMRLNAFSDIPWELIAPWMLDIPGVQFYDYTKNWSRVSTENYHLTFSVDGNRSDSDIKERVSMGDNVAIVFDVPYRPNANHQAPLPDNYLGVKVIDGDKNDIRYEDPPGVIVGLRMKGKKLQANPGKFVRHAA